MAYRQRTLVVAILVLVIALSTGIPAKAVPDPFSGVTGASDGALFLAETTTDSLVSGGGAEVIAQYETVSNLQQSAAASFWPYGASAGVGSGETYEGLTLAPVFVAQDPRPSEGCAGTCSNFVYVTSAILTFDSSVDQCRCSGRAVLNVYRGTASDPAWAFWATSQQLSITPMNKKIHKIGSSIEPSDALDLIDWSPEGVTSGDTSTVTLTAGLGTVGASGSISVSWTRPGSKNGGGVLNNGTHFTIWQSGSSCDAFSCPGTCDPKGVKGVETWRTPKDASANFTFEAGAWFRSFGNPC